MVSTLDGHYRFFIASDSDLDKLLRGESVTQISEKDLFAPASFQASETGVLVALGKPSQESLRPLALVCPNENIRWLCGRYAQLRKDLSPLTAWCHLLIPTFLRSLDGVVHEPKFGGTEAAWSGLAIAETLLLTGRPLASIRITACLASATFAIGRTSALWSGLTCDAIIERFDYANKLCRGRRATPRNKARADQVRLSFLPMWSCLSALSDDTKKYSRDDLLPLVLALRALHQARTRSDDDEAGQLVGPLLKEVPEAKAFEQLAEMAPEARLKLFDELVKAFKETDAKALLRRNALALTTGYLATVAAGGAASLALVDAYADSWPELTGWAYLVGGIGEKITWTSGFDGLGRLVAREFQRPLRLDEAPTCDFSFDEAVVLSDMRLREPLVHLRIKQSRVVSVALYPGVNIAIPILDTSAAERSHRRTPGPMQNGPSEQLAGDSGNLLKTISMALWPYLRPLVIEETLQRSIPRKRRASSSQRTRRKGKADTGSQLPLRGSRK